MKIQLLTGIAALSLFSAAHADTAKLPKNDPLIGFWCVQSNGKWTARDAYKRVASKCKGDGTLTISQEGFELIESGCTFSELKRIRDGYSVVGECAGEGLYWNERAELRIVGKTLSYHVTSSTQWSGQEDVGCAVVSVDIPEDGLLNLRAGPGTEFKVKAKLIGLDRIKVDAVSNGWTHVYEVARLKNADGWVRDKFIQETSCDSAEAEQKPETVVEKDLCIYQCPGGFAPPPPSGGWNEVPPHQ